MQSKKLVVALAFACSALTPTAMIAPEPAHAQIAVVDLKSIAQQIKQVSQMAQSLQQLQQQVRQQTQMLQRLGSDISPELNSIVGDVSKIMQTAQGLGYTVKATTQQIESIYPKNLLGATYSQMLAHQDDWENRTRAARNEALQAQSAVAEAQGRTQTAVNSAVKASQGAAGQTAAVQATNQLIAAVSGQLSQMQTLLITQMRAAETANAELAAKQAAGRERHRQNFGDPNKLPSFGTGY